MTVLDYGLFGVVFIVLLAIAYLAGAMSDRLRRGQPLKPAANLFEAMSSEAHDIEKDIADRRKRREASPLPGEGQVFKEREAFVPKDR
jgi:hypothetical protein